MPAFPVSVPMDLYQDVARACGEPYADSYLFGAVVDGGRLLPRTVTAWERLKDRAEVQAILREHRLKLIKPPPFGSN